ncbi:MAG: O-antigen ligase family protein [Cytophagales bacterium]|nr:O-antigen ligase family protein [Cytophagales bacterium]
MNRLLKFLLYLYVFLIPFEHILVKMYDITNIFKPYRVTGIILTLFVVVSIILSKTRLRFDKFDKVLLFIYVYGFMAGMIYYAFGYGNLYSLTNDALLIFQTYFIFVAIKNLPITHQNMRNIFSVFVAAVFINTLYFQLFVTADALTRESGFFKNPNTTALSIVMSVFILIYQIINDINFKRSFIISLKTALIIFFFFSIFNTGARGAVVGLFTGSLIFFYFNLKTTRYRFFHMFIAITIALSVYYLYDKNIEAASAYSVLGRYQGEQMKESSGRLDIWRSASLLALDHYFLGVGIAQYASYHHEYLEKLSYLFTPELLSQSSRGTHSDYLALFTEFGLHNLILFLMIIFWILRDLAQLIKSSDMNNKIYVFFIAVVGCLVVNGIFTTSLKSPIYWLFFALATYIITNYPIFNQGIIDKSDFRDDTAQ